MKKLNKGNRTVRKKKNNFLKSLLLTYFNVLAFFGSKERFLKKK